MKLLMVTALVPNQQLFFQGTQPPNVNHRVDLLKDSICILVEDPASFYFSNLFSKLKTIMEDALKGPCKYDFICYISYVLSAIEKTQPRMSLDEIKFSEIEKVLQQGKMASNSIIELLNFFQSQNITFKILDVYQ